MECQAKMDQTCCLFKETFSDVCGHVTTVIEHRFLCARNQARSALIPYPVSSEIEKGFKLNLDHHYFKSCRWANADTADSKCMYCQAVESGKFTNTDSSSSVPSQLLPPDTWISDPGIGEYKVIPPAEIQSRRAYWKNYMADQAILYQRQYKMQENYHDAAKALVNHVEEQEPGQVINTETWDHLSWKVTRAKQLLNFYEFDQNRYLSKARDRDSSMEGCLFDPTYVTSLTHDLLYHVKPEEIPSGEICLLCKKALDSPENGVDVVRVFCGLHLFHHRCIVKWFKKSEGFALEFACPTCRKTREFSSMPYFGQDWYSNSTGPLRPASESSASDASFICDGASDDTASDDDSASKILDGVH